MNSHVQPVSTSAQAPGQVPVDVPALMKGLGAQARAAVHALGLASTAAKNLALTKAAAALRRDVEKIIAANRTDMEAATKAGVSKANLDRLMLDAGRVEAMARGLDEIAELPDPVGRVLSTFERPNGLKIERVATPLGVIGVIYESRPNVTADAGALCLSCAAAPTVSIRHAPSMPVSLRVCAPPVCRKRLFRSCRSRTVPLLAKC